ncbi:hypothetical protein [Gemmatimonas sp.]|uniref:hypothetical protein n=1 Tax=Gemmatimonas sp. TaxID=1962908 RepID=UPI0027BA91E3|nr:hypothetical protein [Gemmatimonas sp.]
MSEEKKDPNELGALWLRQSAKGEYLTGTINGVPVVCFLNRHKKDGDNKPTWRVLKSQPKGERPDAKRDEPAATAPPLADELGW